jgi:menaquinone-dependent protoporphyrinogen oxidase
MTRTLVAYASKHGSTQEVARWIGSYLRDAGHDVDVRDAATVTDIDPYDAVILGGSLYMGRWHADARAFLQRHRAAIAEHPLAVFALGPLTLEEGQVAGSRRQLRKALTHLGVRPQFAAVFGGVVDPEKLRFPFSRMAQADARDWSEIEAWMGEVTIGFADYVPAEPV